MIYGCRREHIKQEPFEQFSSYVKLESFDPIVKKEEYIENTSSEMLTKSKTSKKKKVAKAKNTPPEGIKNVVKNYAKAMCSFAYSDLAAPYLSSMIKIKKKATKKGFKEWIYSIKESMDSIEVLRWSLLPTEEDPKPVQKYKKLFQALCEIFLKYFAVNWIYSGRLRHTETHLNFRFKMLRRVQNPENFTYIRYILT